MRKVSIICTVFVFLVAAGASAGTITSISPTSVVVASGEYFVTINGTGLGDQVRFTGGGGVYTVNINARTASGVVSWVPMEVSNVAAHYSVVVLGGTGDSNAVGFDVIDPNKLKLALYLPEFVTALAKTREGAFIKYDVVASGGDDPSPVVDCKPASGSLFPLGTTLVQCTATNRFGERAVGEFPVTAYDGTAPVVTVPRSFSVNAPDSTGAVVKFDASATDDIDGALLVTCTPASGTLFPVGTTTVACTATDSWGNTGGGSFDVNVLWKTLVIHVPAKIVAEALTAKGSNVDFEVTATSPDDDKPVVKCDPASGSFFALGSSTVTCTAYDRLGNTDSGRFEVAVVDTVGPTISSIFAKPYWILPTGDYTTVSVGVEPVDVVDPAPKCSITGVTANEPIDPSDWKVVGDLDVALRGITKGRENRVYAVLVRCTDSTLNSTDANVNVTVSDKEPPAPLSIAPIPAPAPVRRRGF